MRSGQKSVLRRRWFGAIIPAREQIERGFFTRSNDERLCSARQERLLGGRQFRAIVAPGKQAA